MFPLNHPNMQLKAICTEYLRNVSSIININFSLYDIAKTHKWEKEKSLTSK